MFLSTVTAAYDGDGVTEIRYLDHRIAVFPAAVDLYWEEVVEHVLAGGVQVSYETYYDDEWLD